MAMDMSSMWFDYLGSLWCAGPLGKVTSFCCEGGCCCEEHCICGTKDDGCGDGPDVEVSKRKGVDVYVYLDCSSRTLKGGVCFRPLVDCDGAEATITVDVVDGPRKPWVRVVVDDAQGAGKFHGLILDEDGKKICGTLTVEVCED